MQCAVYQAAAHCLSRALCRLPSAMTAGDDGMHGLPVYLVAGERGPTTGVASPGSLPMNQRTCSLQKRLNNSLYQKSAR